MDNELRELRSRQHQTSVYGETPEEFKANIDEIVKQICMDYPDIEPNDISISCDAIGIPYEDDCYGVLSFNFETLETDAEYKNRITRVDRAREEELKQMRQLMSKYKFEAIDYTNEM